MAKVIKAFCDGCKKGKTVTGEGGKGGWGFVFSYVNGKGCTIKVFDYGGNSSTSIGEMELAAFTNCLESFPLFTKGWHYFIFLDSQYVAKSMVKNGKGIITSRKNVSGYVKGWMKNGWKKTDKKPVKFQNLWLKILKRIDDFEKFGIKLEVCWVPREENKEADKYANEGVKLV